MRNAKVQAVIDLAKRKKLNIRELESCVEIRTGKTGRSCGIVIWDDSTANRIDCDLSVALTIRSAEVMREILGL